MVLTKVRCDNVVLVKYSFEEGPSILAAWCSEANCENLAKRFRDETILVCEKHGVKAEARR